MSRLPPLICRTGTILPRARSLLFVLILLSLGTAFLSSQEINPSPRHTMEITPVVAESISIRDGAEPRILSRLSSELGDLGILLEFDRAAVLGFWCVVATFSLFVMCVILNAMVTTKSQISIYRPYELKLLQQDRIDLKDITAYHAQYRWGNYASVCIGMVLVSVTMLAIDGATRDT